MRNFRLRALAYAAIVLLGLLAALPSILPKHYLEGLPSWYSEHQVTLGLDLRGGSHLLLQVETDELVDERVLQLAENLAQRLDEAGISHSNPRATETGSRIIVRSKQNLDEAYQLARAYQAEESPNQLDISRVQNALELTPTTSLHDALTRDAVERSLEVVRRRLNETGVVEPLITRQGEDGVLVQLPGVADPGRIKELLGRTARLTFHLVVDSSSFEAGSTMEVPGAEPGSSYRLQQRPLLEGGHLTDARLGFDQTTGEALVTFRLNSSGAELFADITRANVGNPFAVVLDDEVITAPVIRTPITGGAGEISGDFTVSEARDLSLLLRAGSLPAPLKVVEERTVGPDLGSDAIKMGVTTGMLGAALVPAFMVAVYGRWGLIANTALLVNAGLTIGILATLGATLTLPGIAGLILSIGMAVDANILINERIREESQKGSSGVYDLHVGFKRAFTTILDSNITTLIAVGLLFMFGTGPIRGFAVTIAVGLLVSMFTSISVTRLIMEWRVSRLGREPLQIASIKLLNRIGASGAIPFMKARGMGLALSAVLSLASLGLLYEPGLNEGIDFQGGTVVEVHADEATSIEGLRAALNDYNLGEASIQQFGVEGNFLVRLPVKTAHDADGALVDHVREAVLAIAPEAEFPRVEIVGPSVSGQFFDTSVLAVLLAGTGMFLYLWFRYERYFAIGAMITLALDLTKTLGFFALLGIEFNLTAIAALLALIGYSVNDKVVVFDRIRENLQATPDKPLRELINESLTSTLTRTVFTSLTTFLAVLPMGIAGGDAVASFALPMLFGIVVGTSSSIFIASPVVLLLGERAIRAQQRQEAEGIDLSREEDLFLREDRP